VLLASKELPWQAPQTQRDQPDRLDQSEGEMQETPIRRAVVLLHIVDRSDLIWIPPLVQRIKVEAYTKDHGFELVEILSDGFENSEDPAFFNRAFQMLEDGKAEVLIPLKLEGGRLMPLDPKAA